MAHSRQEDHKNSQGKVFSHSTPIAFADPGLLQAQLAVEKLMNSPYLSLKGPVLTVIKPTPSQTPGTSPAFADPGLLQAQQAHETLMNAPYLTLNGSVLTVNQPVSKQPPSTSPAFANPNPVQTLPSQQDLHSQQTMERLFNSPYLTLETPSAPLQKKGISGDPAQQARERLMASPYLTIRNPSAPIQNTSLRSAPTAFTHPAPTPGTAATAA